MGFYLSCREGVNDLESWQIVLFGPKGLKDLMHSSTFDDDYFTNVQVIEFPDNLEQPCTENNEGEMIVDEESKAGSEVAPKQLVSFVFVEEMQRIAFKDENVTIFPVRARSSADPNDQVFSFVCIPEQVRGKFLPQEASKLGCKPKEHFKILTQGQAVTLEDGSVVTSAMVSEKPAPSCACELIFLPHERYLESFIAENQRFHQILQDKIPERWFNTALVYHSVSIDVLRCSAYREHFMYKFHAEGVKHILDNSDVNLEDYPRPKSHQHTQVVRTICPQITPIESIDFSSANAERHEKLEALMQQINTER